MHANASCYSLPRKRTHGPKLVEMYIEALHTRCRAVAQRQKGATTRSRSQYHASVHTYPNLMQTYTMKSAVLRNRIREEEG